MKKLLIILILTIFTYSKGVSQVYKLDSLHLFSWSSSSTNWNHNARELYTYTNGGTKETNVVRINKVAFSVWENFYQFNKTYNAANELTQNIRQNWDVSTSVWNNLNRKEYTFDASQNEVQYLENLFYNSTWNNYLKEINNFSGQNIIEKITQNYSFTSNTYQNDKKYLYAYNSSNQLILKTKKQWIDYLSQWENEDKISYSYSGNLLNQEEKVVFNISSQTWNNYPLTQINYVYDTNNNLISKTELLWNASANQLRNYKQTLYTYTGNNLIEIIKQTWSTTSNVWVNTYRDLKTYTVNNNLNDWILQTWNTTTNSWENYIKTTYFWSLASSFVLKSEGFSISKNKFYPNPTQNETQLNLEDPLLGETVGILTDCTGKKLRTIRFYAGTKSLKINLQMYDFGVYFFTLQTAKEKQVFRFIKR